MRCVDGDRQVVSSLNEIAPQNACNVAAGRPIHNLVPVLNIRPEERFGARIGTRTREYLSYTRCHR